MSLSFGDRVMVKGKGAGYVQRVDGRKVLVMLDLGLAISVDLDLVSTKKPTVGTEGIGNKTISSPSRTDRKETFANIQKILSGDDPSETLAPPAAKRRQLPSAQVESLRDIESLRYGVVPYGSIEDLTMRFDEMEQWVHSRLPHKLGHPSVLEVCGPFGTGKSHTMSLIRHIARKHKYLTARVEIDGGEVTLANPEGLLRSLWPSLIGTDFSVSSPIVELCVRAISRGESAPKIKAEVERTYENYRTISTLHQRKTLDDIAEELEGVMTCSGEFSYRDVQSKIIKERLTQVECFVRPPIANSVSARPSHFLECLIGYTLVAERAGFTGLVITIDEFEIEGNQSKINAGRIAELVLKLIDYFRDRVGYVPSPLSIFFATISDADSIGDQLIDTIVGDEPNSRYLLSPLSSKDILELARRIFAKYSQAYNLTERYDPALASSTLKHVDQNSVSGLSVVREFIKTWLYVLDSSYGQGVN